LLLLLELLLELRGHGGHRRRAGLEALLRLGLARKPSELLLEWLSWRLHGRLSLAREAGILLLERLLPEAGGLRRKWRGLLSQLLAGLLSGSHVVERRAILLAGGTLAVPAA
jgi:hypothetical protein